MYPPQNKNLVTFVMKITYDVAQPILLYFIMKIQFEGLVR